MSFEITYRNGSMDGRTKRVRSMGEQASQQKFVWKEFANGKPTGNERTEIYVLDRTARTYYLRGSDGGTNRGKQRF